MNVFQFFIICKRTNNANNATHYVKLGKKRRESSKRNYYIISPGVIIKAIIIINKLKVEKHAAWTKNTHAEQLFCSCNVVEQLCLNPSIESRSEPNSNIKGKRSFVPKIWKSEIFCVISKCHNVTLLNFVTLIGLCQTVCIVFSFFSETWHVEKT